MKSRFKTPVVGLPPVLTAALEKLIKTRDAVEQFQARDLTAFGFVSLSTVQAPPQPMILSHMASNSEKRKQGSLQSPNKKQVILPPLDLDSATRAVAQGSNVAASITSAEVLWCRRSHSLSETILSC